MDGDAFLTEPAGGAGRAMSASGQAPILDQEFDSGTLYALRSAVQAHLTRAGLSEDRASEIVLAVHELAANAVAHGAGYGRVRIWDGADMLSCEIIDDGPADPGAARGSSEVVNPWPTQDGHGLWLIRQIADHLDLRSGPRGTRAIIAFSRPRPEDP
jgi:anti-sigma regulatory factor (Ser/Thr protein kinase)